MDNPPAPANKMRNKKRLSRLGTCRDIAWQVVRVPLFYKIVLANSAVSILLGIASASIAVWHVKSLPSDSHYDLIVLLAMASFAISFAVNGLVLKLVLTPLERLQKAAHDVRQGKQDVSITASRISDERLDRVVDTFNQMLSDMKQNTQQLHHLSQQVLHAREEERQRIARELHDEAGQTLTSLLLYLKLLEKSRDPEVAQRIKNLRGLTAYALDEIRQVAVGLYPKILDEWGLAAALGRRVDELNGTNSIQVTLQVEGDELDRLPRDLELAFYRVAQEALNNIARHSSAQRAQVTLKQESNWITLEIQDDGIGFSTAAMQGGGSRGSGLAGMRDRLALIGGELVLESRVGKGTRIVARAPLALEPQRRNS